MIILFYIAKIIIEEVIMKDQNKNNIIVYGTSWCGDTIRAKNIFKENNISFEWIDIDQNQDGRKFVEKTNNGMRSVPTIVFPDGTILVEPSNKQLREKLNLS